VFPVYDRKGNIYVFAGRDITGKHTDKKWKLIGGKHNFIYPNHLAEKFIKETGMVILVESIGDSLSLWESGVKNNLVTFGLSLSEELLSYLMSFSDLKVIVALNNDESKRGNNAAIKMKKKLTKYLGEDMVTVSLPQKGDFGDVYQTTGKEGIQKWHEKTLKKFG